MGTFSAVFTVAGTSIWTCPLNVSAVWLTSVGGGSGASRSAGSSNAYNSSGAGAAEMVCNRLIPVIPDNNYTVTIGAKGMGATTNLGIPVPPTASSFVGPGTVYNALGGGAYVNAYDAGNSGNGGGAGGGKGNVSGGGGTKLRREAGRYAGGAAGNMGSPFPNNGSDSHGGYQSFQQPIIPPPSDTNRVGGGGGATIWGAVNGGGHNQAGQNAPATSYGAGGSAGGASDTPSAILAGGNGCDGYVLLIWNE